MCAIVRLTDFIVLYLQSRIPRDHRSAAPLQAEWNTNQARSVVRELGTAPVAGRQRAED